MESARSLLIGEAPSRPGREAFPLSGTIAHRLCQFAGIGPESPSPLTDYYFCLREKFDVINAIERYEDANPWRRTFARDRVRAYLEQSGTEVVVAFGHRAADALRLRRVPWGVWVTASPGRVAVLPHPSGRCRLYNSPEMRSRAGEILREAMR